MTYSNWQMLACLLVGFVLGLLLSWWLGRRKLHDRLERLDEKWRLKHQGRRGELEACRRELEEYRSRQGAGAEPVPAATAPGAAPAAAAPGEEPPARDDLKKVEGIGPKIEGLLNAAGILTWSQLAAAEASFLRSVLDEAGPRYRVHDPATWPRQAGLAADGAWEKLTALQDRLKGGRET